MQFSGKNDTIGPYDGGEPSIDAAFDTHLDAVQSTITSWVTFDRCAKTQTTRTVGKAIETRWSRGCANGTEVVLWTLLDGGHTWPGGNVLPAVAAKVGPVNHDIVATQEMWTFFSRHVLP
jgi:polyhydroxybutyrate depolymerase